MQRPVIATVVDQHAEDLAVLWGARRTLVEAAHVALRHLARFDQRIAAHQDGCVVAGSYAARRLAEQLADPQPTAVFAASVVALEMGDQDAFRNLLTVAESAPAIVEGLSAALAWTSNDRLVGIVKSMLMSESPIGRRLGLAACRLHGTDPGLVLTASLNDLNPQVRGEALRTIGQLGLLARAPASVSASTDADPNCQFWASWSALVLGNKGVALEALSKIATAAGPQRTRAFRLAFQAMPIGVAHARLQSLAGDPIHMRWLIEGSGIAGDPAYVPWLIGHMADDQTARLAGEAFSLITGTDLALLDLERKPPENFESGPNDNPDDPNVDMDPDDGLPWPDPDRIKDWWAKNSGRFTPGQRYFMGAPVTREHCIDVLKNGYQRQRILAAHYLCLLEPGTPLFNTSAPAWRQQKLLAQMG